MLVVASVSVPVNEVWSLYELDTEVIPPLLELSVLAKEAWPFCTSKAIWPFGPSKGGVASVRFLLVSVKKAWSRSLSVPVKGFLSVSLISPSV